MTDLTGETVSSSKAANPAGTDLWVLRILTLSAFSVSLLLIALDGTAARGAVLVLGGLAMLLVIASLVSSEFPVWLPASIMVGAAAVAVFANDDFAVLALVSLAPAVAGVELATACEHARLDRGMLAPRFDPMHLVLLIGPAIAAAALAATIGVVLPEARIWTLAAVAAFVLVAVAFEARRRRISGAPLPPPSVDRAT